MPRRETLIIEIQLHRRVEHAIRSAIWRISQMCIDFTSRLRRVRKGQVMCETWWGMKAARPLNRRTTGRSWKIRLRMCSNWTSNRRLAHMHRPQVTWQARLAVAGQAKLQVARWARVEGYMGASLPVLNCQRIIEVRWPAWADKPSIIGGT